VACQVRLRAVEKVAGTVLRKTTKCAHCRAAEQVIDLTGKVFGEWTVIERAANSKSRSTRSRCRCSCGAVKTVKGYTLRNGTSQRCRRCASVNKVVDLTGKVFGEWRSREGQSVLALQVLLRRTAKIEGQSLKRGDATRCATCQRDGRNSNRLIDLRNRSFGEWKVLDEPPTKEKGGKPRWRCRCSCGTIKLVNAANLRNGASSRCAKCSRKLQRARFFEGTIARKRRSDGTFFGAPVIRASVAEATITSQPQHAAPPTNQSMILEYASLGIKLDMGKKTLTRGTKIIEFARSDVEWHIVQVA